MMLPELPQIDLGSLSRQQLQHLLETSRRAGRTSMADAVAHEMRERRGRPETPRSWVEVDFADLAAEPEFDFTPDVEPEPELRAAPEPEPEQASEPVVETPETQRQVAPVGPADPYAFGAIRGVPDGSLRVGEPAPRRTTEPRIRAPLTPTRARVAEPRRGRARGVLLGAVALGAAAVAAIAVLGPLQPSRFVPAAPAQAPAPPAAVQVAVAAPTPEIPQAQPLPRAAVALDLRGPISGPIEPAAAAAPRQQPQSPSLGHEFTIPTADLMAAAEAAIRADGLQATWKRPEFAPARCRWSSSDPTLAVCQTRTRYAAADPWRERTGHYRRNADGAWRVAP